jgi:sec-independent protein translocase protein TatB
MEILGIGPLELLFILLIAVIVVGPRNLGKMGKTVGSFLNRLYRSESWKLFNEASKNLRNLPNRLAREAALEELDAVRKDIEDTSKAITNVGRDLTQDAQDLDAGLSAWQPPPPEAGEQATEADKGDN